LEVCAYFLISTLLLEQGYQTGGRWTKFGPPCPTTWQCCYCIR